MAVPAEVSALLSDFASGALYVAGAVLAAYVGLLAFRLMRVAVVGRSALLVVREVGEQVRATGDRLLWWRSRW